MLAASKGKAKMVYSSYDKTCNFPFKRLDAKLSLEAVADIAKAE